MGSAFHLRIGRDSFPQIQQCGKARHGIEDDSCSCIALYCIVGEAEIGYAVYLSQHG
jgi:hypothetical protein